MKNVYLFLTLFLLAACDQSGADGNRSEANALPTSRYNENTEVFATVIVCGATDALAVDLRQMATLRETRREDKQTTSRHPLVAGIVLGGPAFALTTAPPVVGFGTDATNLYRLGKHNRDQLAAFVAPPPANVAAVDLIQLLLTEIEHHPEAQLILLAPTGDYNELLPFAPLVVADEESLDSIATLIWDSNPSQRLLILHRPVFPVPPTPVAKIDDRPSTPHYSINDHPKSRKPGQQVLYDDPGNWHKLFAHAVRLVENGSERTAHHFLNQSAIYAMAADEYADFYAGYKQVEITFAYAFNDRIRQWEATKLGIEFQDERYLSDEPINYRWSASLSHGETQLFLAEPNHYGWYLDRTGFSCYVADHKDQILTLMLLSPGYNDASPTRVVLRHNEYFDVMLNNGEMLRAFNSTLPGSLPMLRFRKLPARSPLASYQLSR